MVHACAAGKGNLCSGYVAADSTWARNSAACNSTRLKPSALLCVCCFNCNVGVCKPFSIGAHINCGACTRYNHDCAGVAGAPYAGVEESVEYQYASTRPGSWDAEVRALERAAEKHEKDASKAVHKAAVNLERGVNKVQAFAAKHSKRAITGGCRHCPRCVEFQVESNPPKT